MTEPNELELVRALVEGRLPPAEVERVEALVADDPELAAFRDEYAFVHGLTAPLAPLGPTTDLRFDEVVPPAAAPARVFRFPVRAAAALLLAAGAAIGGYHLLPPTVPDTVEIAAIPLSGGDLLPAASAELPDVPFGLADYRPTKDGRIQWMDSLEEARALGRLAGRPVLVFSEYPGCPLCKQMEKTAFVDAEVLERIDDVVPVKIDLTKVTKAEFDHYWSQYPYFAIQDTEGAELHKFPGAQTAASLSAGIEAGVGRLDAPSWDSVARFGGAYESALNAEMELRFGDADRAYAELESGSVPRAVREAAEQGRLRISAAAVRSLREARETASTDLSLSLTLLRTAAEQFEGTKYAADLAKTERIARLGGRFPELVETTR